MGDHVSWPAGPRALDAGARCLAYLMAAVAGLDVAYGEVGATGALAGHLSIDVIGLLAGVAGAVGAVGTIFRRWQVEFIAVCALVIPLLAYTVIDWLVLLFVIGYPPIPAAVAAIIAGAAVVAAVATGKKRWRWVAVAGVIVILAFAVPLAVRGPAIMTCVTALLFSRAVGLWVFIDAAVDARRLRNGAAMESDP